MSVVYTTLQRVFPNLLPKPSLIIKVNVAHVIYEVPVT